MNTKFRAALLSENGLPSDSLAGPQGPLLLYFHMQDETTDDAELTEWVRAGNDNNALTIFPEGHNAGGSVDTQCGPSWNVLAVSPPGTISLTSHILPAPIIP